MFYYPHANHAGGKMEQGKGGKTCPICGLGVPLDAKVCGFCGWDFEEDELIYKIDKLEEEIASGQEKYEGSSFDKMVQSTLRDSKQGKHEASKEDTTVRSKDDEDSEEPEIKLNLLSSIEDADLEDEEPIRPAPPARKRVVRRVVSQGAQKSPVAPGAVPPRPGPPPPQATRPVTDASRTPVAPPKPAQGKVQANKPAGARTMKCTTCGGEFDSELSYCPNCGADFDEVDELMAPAPKVEPKVLTRKVKTEAYAEEKKIAALIDKVSVKKETSEDLELKLTPEPKATPEPAEAKVAEVQQEAPKAVEEEPVTIIPEKVEPKKAVPVPAPQEKPSVQRESKVVPIQTRQIRSALPSQGRVNGTKLGRVNGTKQGRVNGTRQGRVNGTGGGKVNGLKKQAKQEEIVSTPSRLHSKIGGRLPLWELLALLVAAVLIISTFAITSLQPAVKEGITLDGYFSDWTSIPSYKFTTLLPGILDGIDSGKLSFKQDVASTSELFVYLDLQDGMFSGGDPSSIYIMIDTDSNPTTGYSAGQSFGADTMAVLMGWNGTLKETAIEQFPSTADKGDWNSWQSSSGLSYATQNGEIEMALDVPLTTPVVKIVTSIDGEECNGPLMSPSGTIVAKQEPLIDGTVATSSSLSLIRVSVVAMGVAEHDYSFKPTLVGPTGSLSLNNFTVDSTNWTTVDLTGDITGVANGGCFEYCLSGTASGFEGAVDIIGNSCSGYFMTAPTRIVVDGVFGDWAARKITDTDAVAPGNPDINIQSYGAATQNDSYFAYVGTEGSIFEGADAPEKVKRGTSSVQGGGSVVKLKKTGEDMLQAFIDVDPSSGIGKHISAGNSSIEADYMVEILGKDGNITESSVMKWSVADSSWTALGDIESSGVGAHGVEFSVNKTLLGNLTSSEIIFFTTDWEGQADDCWLSGALVDPWAVTGTLNSASSFRSNDGISWENAGSIALLPGERVVAIANSLDRTYVFAVTNTGRVYDWQVNVDSSWGTEVTGPCNETNVVGIAPDSVTGEGGCAILNVNGSIWTNNALGTARGWTNASSKVTQGAYDFKDMCYNSTGGRYWALRSAVDTPLYCSDDLASWTATTSTGSSATQVHVYNVGDGAGTPANEKLFVLCEDGTISYSPDGGANWESRGDLPAPGESGLPDYSKYVAIDRDGSGVFWAMTNTSYCYKSTDTGSTWTYTGNFGVNDVASMACSDPFIPEFDSMIVPIVGLLVLCLIVPRRRRGKSSSIIAEEINPL
jgi:predicted  nucleic acid-binding Zn-ribbon protein